MLTLWFDQLTAADTVAGLVLRILLALCAMFLARRPILNTFRRANARRKSRTAERPHEHNTHEDRRKHQDRRNQPPSMRTFVQRPKGPLPHSLDRDELDTLADSDPLLAQFLRELEGPDPD
jgi:hypothetical protein